MLVIRPKKEAYLIMTSVGMLYKDSNTVARNRFSFRSKTWGNEKLFLATVFKFVYIILMNLSLEIIINEIREVANFRDDEGLKGRSAFLAVIYEQDFQLCFTVQTKRVLWGGSENALAPKYLLPFSLKTCCNEPCRKSPKLFNDIR